METINVKSSSRVEMIEITGEIQRIIESKGIKDGICLIYVPHTTAAVTINEGADPSVKRDILTQLSKIVPSNDRYHHTEGNSDAHIKSSILGSSQMIIVESGRIRLGTWQSIYFCEFDGPRNRNVFIKVIGN